MTFYSVSNPFMQVLNLQGTGLNDGDVYFGVAGQDPITNPITVYWDLAGTDVAAQPIPTTGGYLYRSGTPAEIYLDDTYSIKVLDKKGGLVYYQANVFDPVFEIGARLDALSTDAGAGVIGFSQTETYDQGTLGLHGQAQRSVLDAPWNVVGDGVTDDADKLIAAIAWAEAQSPRGQLYLPPGRYKISKTLPITKAIGFCGDTPYSATLVTNGTYAAIAAEMSSSSEYGLKICIGAENTASSPASGDGIRINVAYFAYINVATKNYYNSLHLTQFNLSSAVIADAGWINRSVLVDGGLNFNSSVHLISSGNATALCAVTLNDMVDEWYFSGTASNAVKGFETAAASYVINMRPEFCTSDLSIDSCQNGGTLDNCYAMYFRTGYYSNRPGYNWLIGATGFAEQTRFGLGCNGFFAGAELYIVGARAIGTTLDGIGGNGSQSGVGSFPNVRFAAGCGSFTSNIKFYNSPDVTATPSQHILIENTGSADYQIGGDVSPTTSTGVKILDQRNGAGRRWGDIIGFVTKVTGLNPVITGGTSSVTFAHGLALTPATPNINARPANPLPGGLGVYVSAVTSTQITVTLATNAGSPTYAVTPTTITPDLGIYCDAQLAGG